MTDDQGFSDKQRQEIREAVKDIVDDVKYEACCVGCLFFALAVMVMPVWVSLLKWAWARY